MENFKFKKHDGYAKVYIHENHRDVKEGDIYKIRVFDAPAQDGSIAEVSKKGWNAGLQTEEFVKEIPSDINLLN